MKFLKKPRKMRITKFIVSTVILLFVAMQSASAQKGQVVDKIIAKVDDKIVLKSELESSYISFFAIATGS